MKFVENAKQGWKWFSVQCMAASTALQAAWLTFPEDLKTAWPFIPKAAAAILLAGIVLRFVKQK